MLPENDMKVVEYGHENNEVIVLLHGGGLSWWNYREAAELLQDRYHIIIPILDGHSGSDTGFTTIEDNAKRIIDYIDENYGGKVVLIGGVSLGGQVLVEMLSQRENICKYALIESASVIPDKLTGSLLKPVLNMSFWLIKHKWFSKLQFRSLKIKDELYDEYYKDSCNITKENMLAFLKASCDYELKKGIDSTNAKVFIVAGQRETKRILGSAKKLNATVPSSAVKIKADLYHGEYSINHPKEFASDITGILENEHM